MRINHKFWQLCCTVILGLSSSVYSVSASAQESLEDRLDTYRDRVERLEDQASIENLQATFGYYFDKGLWEEAASLFSNDGSFEYGQMGVYIGQNRIERSMLLFGPEGLAYGHLNNHMMLQNVIIVAEDGETATGRWQGPIQLAKPGASGEWAVGLYENEYVKERGTWKLSKLHFYMTAKTDYDRPWLRGANPMVGQSALFPPDQPPSEVYRSFPGAYIPPFSFNHPVTGESLKDIAQPSDNVLGRE